jgi:RimJ/RimL family protein N-acetyltransferase
MLRRFTRTDLGSLFILHNDPDVMRYLNGGKPTPRREIEREYQGRLAGDGYWAAIERATGNFLGWFCLHPKEGSDPDKFELGYRLGKSAWGKGYATEGACALIRKGFTELGARKIVAETMSVNLASRRVMEKSGLKYVRSFHEDWPDPIAGAEHGEVEYAVTRADWEQQDVQVR